MWNQPSSSEHKPVAAPAAPTSPGPASEPKRTPAIGKSIVIKGDVSSAEDMTIDGHVEGRIEVRGHSLLLGPNAGIQAEVVARVVTIMGSVTGNVTASEKVDLRGSASVYGNIDAPRVAITDGAEVRGRIDSLSARNDQRGPLGIAV